MGKFCGLENIDGSPLPPSKKSNWKGRKLQEKSISFPCNWDEWKEHQVSLAFKSKTNNQSKPVEKPFDLQLSKISSKHGIAAFCKSAQSVGIPRSDAEEYFKRKS